MTGFKQHKKSNSTTEKRRKVLKTTSVACALPGVVNPNLSSTSVATPLTQSAGNLELSTSINGIEVCGSIDSTLTSASSGLLIQPSMANVNSESRDNGYSADFDRSFASIGDGFSGYSACWSTDGSGSRTPSLR